MHTPDARGPYKLQTHVRHETPVVGPIRTPYVRSPHYPPQTHVGHETHSHFEATGPGFWYKDLEQLDFSLPARQREGETHVASVS